MATVEPIQEQEIKNLIFSKYMRDTTLGSEFLQNNNRLYLKIMDGKRKYLINLIIIKSDKSLIPISHNYKKSIIFFSKLNSYQDVAILILAFNNENSKILTDVHIQL